MNDEESSGNAPSPISPRRSASRRVQSKKCSVVTEDLGRQLDKVVFSQLAVLYLLEYARLIFHNRSTDRRSCSFAQLLLRGVVQISLLSPRPKALSGPPAVRIAPILASNCFAFLSHVLSSPPEAGEATRFYLHGSVLIDFVGVKGPRISKLWLILLDILILVLQLTMLSASMEHQKFQKKASGTDEPVVSQDLDAEERGVRSQNAITTTESPDGIELQPLPGRTGADEDGERDQLLAEGTSFSEVDEDSQSLDDTPPGQVIVNLYLWDTIQTQFRMWQNGANAAATSTSQTETVSAFPRFRIRVGDRAL